MTAGIRVRGLGKTFADGSTALREVSFGVRAGELVTVSGPRDSGKSTLVRCLVGVCRPSWGEIDLQVDDELVELVGTPARTLAWLRRHLFADFTGPMVAPPRQLAHAAVARAAHVTPGEARGALARVGLEHVADQPLGRLSGKQRSAVSLATALASPAPVVVLDEPCSVAPPHVVLDWVQDRCATGATVVATTAVGDLPAGWPPVDLTLPPPAPGRRSHPDGRARR
ncbi:MULTISPECIES: ABC transporter ATP-binding protein [unclassified Modestobacter]